ncbi:MAG: fused MFS/spermidine synthase [Theionarchaea archaeon]|nr:fused MFS/spermidine synthase [Theionarchaea archaeon]MBU7037900.1 fused MFS/spermidine synthase [Theionarchaea archaeon]
MKRLLILSILVLGISSVVSQLVVVREFLAVFGGNELIFGIILGNWTLLTGIGSYLGKKVNPSQRALIFLHIGLGVLPLTQLVLLRVTKTILFISGEVADPTELFVWSCALLAPLCLIAGSFLVVACSLYAQKRKPSDIGSVYIIDSLGDIAGGALFSFLLVYFLSQIQIVYVLLVANVSMALITSFSSRSKLALVCAVILVGLGVITTGVDLNHMTVQALYPGQSILHQESSLYGNIVVTQLESQTTMYENGTPFFSTGDVMAREETVHYAMIQRDKNVYTVLLLGGGASGTIQEVLKYPAALDYVELDPSIITISQMYTGNLSGANVFEMDARKYVKEASTAYDVIIVDVPDPDSAQINRLYTVEFFRETKKILAENGIFSTSVSASPNYMGEHTRKLNSSLYRSLKSVFENVIIIPGNNIYFLASDGNLTYDIAQKIEEKGILTQYVNKYYLSGVITEDRIEMVLASAAENVAENTDFSPHAYYYYLSFWMSQFRSHFLVFLAMVVILVIILSVRIATHPVPLALVTAGFAGTALEVVLVLGFQILYGYVYSHIGILITSFLIGLAGGAFYVNRTPSISQKHYLVILEGLLAGFAVLIGIILPHLTRTSFPVIVGIVGALIGSEFPLASRLYYKDIRVTAAALFSADLLGGCLGALMVSTLLIPVLGVIKVCLLVGTLSFMSALLVLWKG